MSEWRPISEFPRNKPNKPYLLWVEIPSPYPPSMFYHAVGYWGYFNQFEYGDKEGRTRPTHFMELPPGPTEPKS